MNDDLEWCGGFESITIARDLLPFTEKQLTFLGTVPKQVFNFCSLCIFCLGRKTIRLRTARQLIVLHPKPNL